MSEVLDIAIEKINTVVTARIVDYTANWLENFKPKVREADPSLEFFTLIEGRELLREEFNYLTPEAVNIWETVPSRHAPGLSGFVKGAASVANLISSEDAKWMGEFLSMQMAAIQDEDSLPSVIDEVFPLYAECVVTILCNEELSSWRELLSYNLGVWWAVGHCKNRNALRGNETATGMIYKIMQDKAMRGVIDG